MASYQMKHAQLALKDGHNHVPGLRKVLAILYQSCYGHKVTVALAGLFILYDFFRQDTVETLKGNIHKNILLTLAGQSFFCPFCVASALTANKSFI